MIYPFAALSLGAAAFSQLVMFDMGHAVLVWTVTTVVACKYGGHADDIPVLLKRTLAAPPLWVLIIALALNRGRRADSARTSCMCVLLIGPGADPAGAAGHGTAGERARHAPARGHRRGGAALAVSARWSASRWRGCSVSTAPRAAIALIGAAAPIGFTAVVLSAREGLDLDLAASAAAISVFLGIVVDSAGHDVRSTLSRCSRAGD